MRETSSDMEEMSKWHPEEQGKGRLTEGEAHDEANMMRVKMGVKPGEAGEFRAVNGGFERGPSAREYEQAFVAIEQLKQAAGNESDYKKAALKVLRVVARPFQELLSGLDAISPTSARNVHDWQEERLHMLDDAEKRLRDMQKLGAGFGNKE
jgi:hypothetical protein